MLRWKFPANCTFLRLLREKLGLAGNKEGCGIGESGTCSVPLMACPKTPVSPSLQGGGRAVGIVEGPSGKKPITDTKIDPGGDLGPSLPLHRIYKDYSSHSGSIG